MSYLRPEIFNAMIFVLGCEIHFKLSTFSRGFVRHAICCGDVGGRVVASFSHKAMESYFFASREEYSGLNLEMLGR